MSSFRFLSDLVPWCLWSSSSVPEDTDLLNFDFGCLSFRCLPCSRFLISRAFPVSSASLPVVCSTLATQGSDASAPQAADVGGPVIADPHSSSSSSSDGLQRSPDDDDDDKLAVDVEQDGTSVDAGRTTSAILGFLCYFFQLFNAHPFPTSQVLWTLTSIRRRGRKRKAKGGRGAKLRGGSPLLPTLSTRSSPVGTRPPR